MSAEPPRVPVVRFVFREEDAAPFRENRPYTVVYDGDCRVCTRLARLLARWDRKKRIAVVPSSNGELATRFPWIRPEEYAAAMQLVGPGGKTHAGAEAVEELLTILPQGWLFGWVFAIPGVGWIADRLYRWFARNRYRFGCGDHCRLRPGGNG